MPGPKPGTPKPIGSGRVAGTPNRITFDIVHTLREMGFDPLAELVNVNREAMRQYEATEEVLAIVHEEQDKEYSDDEEPRMYVRREIKGRSADFLKIVASTCAEVAQYVYPKRKALDHLPNGNGNDGGKVKQVVLYVPSNGR